MCYEGFYAFIRSAKSQTLKVHPVASKTLTQKRPVFLGTVTCPNLWSSSDTHSHTLSQLVEPRSSETVARLHCRCAAFGGGVRVLVEPRRWGCCSPLSTPPSRVHSRCLAVSQIPRSKQEMNPAHTVRPSQQQAPQRPANTGPRPHAAFSSVCHYWCHFHCYAIVTHNH